MDRLVVVARWVFASFYTFVGASWFFSRLFGIPLPDHKGTPEAEALVAALASSGIVDPLIFTTSLAGGLLLFFRRTAPLAIAVLAPLVTGIFLFHLVLNQSWPWGVFNFCYLAILAWLHRSAFKPLWDHGVPPALQPRDQQ